MPPPKKRNRRSPEEMIADLEARIAEVKRRAVRKKIARDPALRHVKAALRSVDKAVSATQDAATRQALGEARTHLAACLALHGAEQKSPRGVLIPQPRRGGKVDADSLLGYLRAHPGSRSEEIATALGTDTKTLRPVLQRLRSEERARAEGKGRATTYFASV